MHGDGRFRSKAGLRLLLLMSAGCALAPGQVITSVQSSQNGSSAQNITSVTGGSPLPNGFTIYLNAAPGSFAVGAPTVINWNSLGGTPSGNFPATVNNVGSQVSGIVSFPLFQNPVGSTVTVLVSVTQNGSTTSGAANFFIVPKPSPVGPLPNAFVGTPYATPIVNNGTAPYKISTMIGSPPAGINFDNFNGLLGTPLGPPGLDNFQPTLADFWGNAIALNLGLQVVGTPTITAVKSSFGATYPYGSLTNLSVTVGPVPATPTFGAGVQFRDGSTVLGTAGISQMTGVATLPNVFLAGGVHSTISALFLGDTNWLSVASGNTTITVTPGEAGLFVTGSPFSAIYGGTLSAGSFTLTGMPLPAAPPTGTVTLTSGAIAIATFNATGSGIVTGTPLPASLNAGSQPLTFTYSGDANYGPVIQLATVNIAKATPTAALKVSLNPIPLGQTEMLTATLNSPTVGVPGGAVTFFDASVPIPGGAIPLVSGAGTFNANALAVGSHPITFSYSGDTNFTPVTSATTIVTVTNPPLAFTSNNLPGGVVSQPYYPTTLGVTGGVVPYTYSATGLPPGLGINSTTGVISGTPTTSGGYAPSFTVTDSAVPTAAKITGQFAISISGPPIRISQFSTLPDGVVGVGYSGSVGVNGGVDPITFSISGGAIPPGLKFLSNGLLTGTPTTVGKYTFTVRVTDGANNSDSKDYTVTIQPAPLSFTGGSSNPGAVAGTPLNINFGCTGGVPPYTYSVSGALPPGVTFANCVLSGTPTTPGTYSIHIVITDSTGASAAKDVTITVAAPGLTLKGGALPDGQVGVAYTGAVSATGGVPPITYSGSGLPDGLSLASSGAITGTPTTSGTFSFQVTATDSSKLTAPVAVSATFTITIVPATLAFGAASLPDGQVGVAYSGSVSATGGTKPYAFSITGLPDGLTATAAGAVSGTPTTSGAFTVSVMVRDAAEGRAVQTYTVKIAPAALVIPTASAPNGTVGVAYSATFTATGGIGPYTFTATGQPSTLTMSTGGTLSGTPNAAGTFSLTITAKDSTGVTISKSFPVNIALPPPPTLNFGGISTTVNPLQQPRVTVSLASPFPVDVIATLTLTSQPDSGPVDPAVAFVTGGNTATITIPAGSLNGATDVGFQTGTVAGTITITAKLTASGADVTPAPAPKTTTRVNAAVPVLVTVTATRTSTGFTVSVVGYVTDREITTGNFGFSGNNLGTTSLAVPLDTIFAGWFGGNTPPAAPYGGQFGLNQPFVVNGSNTSITSVTVTLTNKVGTSNSITVNLN